MRINPPIPNPAPVDPDRIARILASAQDRRERRKAKHKPKVFQVDLRDFSKSPVEELVEMQRQATDAHEVMRRIMSPVEPE